MTDVKSAFSLLTALLLGAGAFPALGADAEAGKQKAQVCSACHGSDGNSPNVAWPNLAGQQATYLKIQLKAIRDGSRKNPLMKAVVEGLDDEDVEDLAAYFSGLTMQAKETDVTPEQLALGEEKYAACATCHGLKGEGAKHIPRLASQNRAYLIKQMQNFETGARSSPSMKAMASTLSEEETDAVAAYLASLTQ